MALLWAQNKCWGRGIGTMVDECKRVGLPAPEFNTDGSFVWVVFKYNRNSVVTTQQATQQATKFIQELISAVNTNEYSATEVAT